MTLFTTVYSICSFFLGQTAVPAMLAPFCFIHSIVKIQLVPVSKPKQKKTNTSAVGTHSRKTCTHTKTIRARADAPAQAASCKLVRFPRGKVQSMRKGSFTEPATKNVLKSQVNCARARAIIRRDAQRPFQPVTERARSTQWTTGTFEPKGGGQENGMLPSLGILKTMSINPWCHILTMCYLTRHLTHLLCTNEAQNDIFC